MAVFCSPLIPPFPSTLLRYCLTDFQMVPVAPIITGITFVFTVHMRSVSTVQSLYFRLLSAPLLTTILPPHFTSLPFPPPHITLSSLLLAAVLSVSTVRSTIWLPYLPDMLLLISVHGHTVQLCRHFLPYLTAQLSTHSIMSLSILPFCHHWTRWYKVKRSIDVSYCLQSLHLLSPYRSLVIGLFSPVETGWIAMAHARKPDFFFRRNWRVHLNRRGRQFSRLLAAEVCESVVVMLDTPCSEVVWRVLATHSIRHFPSRASPCAITFQLDSTSPEPAVNPTAQSSSFTLQHLPHYVWCSKCSCLL
jgi:prepilin signal peptidase PulO-like enzyme (type II secretory pathway)